MNSIIKHFEFKSSEGQVVSVDAARYNGKPVFLAVDLARALGYADPHDALNKHCKSLIKLNSGESTELGFGPRPRGVILAGQSDMFRLIMRSNLPSAERVQDWVCEEVLPALMETGTYSIRQEKSSSGLPEYRIAKAEQLKAQALEKNIASARELMAMLPRLDPMAHQTLAASLINPLVGYDAIPLPMIEEHYYTAAEAGQKIGVSANKIGRIANANNLKTEQYGKFFLDKSAHSSKQVEAFRYNANGIEALRHLIHGADVA
ncbi:Bro-N domain-containing protein [Salmonella enterica subsp. enterica serovar Thompson]|uniref:Phage repressor protein n=1 Tax=Salmonella enterica TaxID=28901 RepID=A0A5T3M3Y2_SALER|nr:MULTISPECIES: Bro-N domain-containing protein [Salmonella]EAC0893929.1 phage repressor protein [Salmonella enterica subsp. enterica serovar Virchow]EBO3568233.1 Bro-N domain-containing protein [Salmonella enterica subsp. enterica serovar Montevideo]EHX6743752.1 Bro-N domain-containing protein [Salmonella enterica subsp. enterica serovar Rissen]MCL8822363.1 Bro-N domain-containing protein [Salmonella enterica subsp. enterica serovar Enteritidis]EAM9370895.1 phage repressor protein [Salmonell